MKLYLAGPMTVHKDTDYGERLFADTTAYLRSIGHEVWSPAEYDIEQYGSLEEAAKQGIRKLLLKDFDIISRQEGIALCAGWELSTVGVPAEIVWAARVNNLPVFAVDEMETNGLRRLDLDIRIRERMDSAAEEAAALVTGARRWSYGHPKENFEAIGRYWRAHLINAFRVRAEQRGVPVGVALGGEVAVLELFDPIEDVAAMMMLTKMARELNATKRDNAVDIAGYAEAMYQGKKKRGDYNG